MCYYLNVQFQGQRVKLPRPLLKREWNLTDKDKRLALWVTVFVAGKCISAPRRYNIIPRLRYRVEQLLFQCSSTWFVPKVSVLIFYLYVYSTHLKLKVITFKVWPLGSYTVVPLFFPLIIAVLEVIFRKCVKLIGYNFLYVFHRPEMMTLQLRFQLREEVEIARS